ncbi:MAG: FKBP-type peptidyl-prolyl cis-trans isomerase [Prevotellaceae bacterium]|jgi:FKBP-type peptidyl-prolyl cis-trans isomerase|nr:FKBP-type peptidyl-prolyl cis-trans isomerase [Prevotellaceae bacterium]
MNIKVFFAVLLTVFYTSLRAELIDDSVAYSMGIQIAINLQKQGVLDKFEQNASFVEAFKDMRYGQSKMTLQEMERVLTKYFNDLVAREKAENGAMGQVFLEKNAKEQGVVVLPSGLQYKIVKQGAGTVKPTPADSVEVHYTGSLVNGKVFESSRNTGVPVKFLLNGVITGWKEGLQQITEGGTIMLYIPPAMAYGDRVMQGSQIGPNSTLIFEIELLKIIAAK